MKIAATMFAALLLSASAALAVDDSGKTMHSDPSSSTPSMSDQDSTALPSDTTEPSPGLSEQDSAQDNATRGAGEPSPGPSAGKTNSSDPSSR